MAATGGFTSLPYIYIYMNVYTHMCAYSTSATTLTRLSIHYCGIMIISTCSSYFSNSFCLLPSNCFASNNCCFASNNCCFTLLPSCLALSSCSCKADTVCFNCTLCIRNYHTSLKFRQINGALVINPVIILNTRHLQFRVLFSG